MAPRFSYKGPNPETLDTVTTSDNPHAAPEFYHYKVLIKTSGDGNNSDCYPYYCFVFSLSSDIVICPHANRNTP